MEKQNKENEKLIADLQAQYSEILASSEQAIYFYLDDAHKLCNEKFASMLGYASPQEWQAVTESFPMAFVAEGSREALVGAYQNAMQKHVGSQTAVTWAKKGEIGRAHV